MLYNLIYRSRINKGALSEESINDLIEKSANANIEREISGILLHDDTHFFQILEGPKEKIEDLYKKILQDLRHTEVVLITLEPIPTRLHSELGMKFFKADEFGRMVNSNPGFYLDEQLHAAESTYRSRTKKFITQFTNNKVCNKPSRQEYKNGRSLSSRISRSETLKIASAPNKINFAFQPVIDCVQKQTFFVEALVRGPNGQPADQYLSGMNKNELHDFDLHSTSDAIALAAQLNIHNLSINFNPRTLFESTEITNHLEKNLEKYHFVNHQLIIEITEKDIIRNYAGAFDTLAQLRSRGIRLAIDDFGAGYAGLSLLAEYQPDIIKIDRSIISNIHYSGAKQSIVNSIFTCCENMAITVCAEGVESEEDFHCLLDIGIKKFQGFLFGMPTINSYSEISFT